MTDAKRGRGLRHGVYLAAVAALGFALSGCGGGGSSSATASIADSSGAPQGSTATQGSAPTQGTSTGSGSTNSGSTGSGTNTGSGSGGGTSTTANVTIDWVPPTENVDGTTLTNLAGYNIHYGTASHSYTHTISVTNPGLARYVVESLTPGKYYFAVAAVNSAGTESPLSSEVSTTVN